MSRYLPHLKTIQSVSFVTKTGIEVLSPESLSADIIGDKAFGLAALPINWTLPFIVVSSDMFIDFQINNNEYLLRQEWEALIQKALKDVGVSPNDNIIVRSNACHEDLSLRGMYTSIPGYVGDVISPIIHCFKDMLKEINEEIQMPILIQKEVTAVLSGHLSNERRIAREIRDFQCEFNKTGETLSINLRPWRRKTDTISYESNPLVCPSIKNDFIQNVLTIPSQWAKDKDLRIHFEWVFDGTNIYIVQADEEMPKHGVNPTKIYKKYKYTNPQFKPRILHKLSAEDKEHLENYEKIQNVLIYEQLSLPTAPIYLLYDKETISSLINGCCPQALYDDLIDLLQCPLIIRMDIDTTDQKIRQLLPRTCEIRDIKLALDWLLSKSKEISQQVNSNFIFILHNFIPAISSAFAYAKPGNSNVLIESLWGLPDGLFFNQHDICIVETSSDDVSKMQKDNFCINYPPRYKDRFLTTNSDGSWVIEDLGYPYDWGHSIKKNDWIKEIAYHTRRIANHYSVNQGVSVMWFVGVSTEIYGTEVFPWHFEPYEYNHALTQPNKKKGVFSKQYTVSTREDWERYKQSDGLPSQFSFLRLKPTEESLFRDKDFIKEIGELAKRNNTTILLDGGILSHAYYQLKRTEANVEVTSPFDSLSGMIYGKLVRDKIPDKINKHGEVAHIDTMPTAIHLSLLKRKLVEEALEVFDSAQKKDTIEELADTLEVIDSIKKLMKITEEELQTIKDSKREKAGGFEKGIFLNRTSKPLPDVLSTDSTDDINPRITKWTDSRRLLNYTQEITKVKIPIDVDEWEFDAFGNEDKTLVVKFRGKRTGASLSIEVSSFEEMTFDKYLGKKD